MVATLAPTITAVEFKVSLIRTPKFFTFTKIVMQKSLASFLPVGH